ncbi:MAG: putative TPR repeat methyltransferase [Sulfitobacter sp.]|jgi:predicted TPR repeat methyltransferase
MNNSFLDKAYGARDANETRALYDKWAASYEAELGENGYVTPQRCAAALVKFSKSKALPILDFGCGTGLSGLALRLAGFETIDGVDVSADMLARAREKSIYRTLTQIDADKRFIPAAGDYAALAAIGVIGAGAAPISVFDTLMKSLTRGGLFVFSFNDHALEDPAHEGRVNEWIDCGAARLLFCEHGDHIPGIGLKAKVYLLEKN